MDNLSDLEIKELLYISLVALISQDEGVSVSRYKRCMVPEILAVVGVDSFLSLLKYFPGKCIEIPTQEEMKSAAKLVFYYYLLEVEKKDKKEISNILGDCRSLPNRSQALKDFFSINSFKIPNNFCCTDFLKKMNISLCEK